MATPATAPLSVKMKVIYEHLIFLILFLREATKKRFEKREGEREIDR